MQWLWLFFSQPGNYNSETYGTCKQAFHITGSTDVHIILHMFEFPYAGSLIVPFQTVGGSFNFYCFYFTCLQINSFKSY